MFSGRSYGGAMTSRRNILLLVAILTMGALASGSSWSQTNRTAPCTMGESVTSSDASLGMALRPVSARQVGYWDADADARAASFEPLVVDVDSSGSISVGDIRWSPGPSEKPPGSRVAGSDEDVGAPLMLFELVQMLSPGTKAWSPGDSVVLDVDLNGNLTSGDRYMAPPSFAGMPYSGQETTQPPAATPFQGRLMYLDQDGDGKFTAWDDVIWDRDNSTTVSVSDLCLSTPLPAPTASSSAPPEGTTPKDSSPSHSKTGGTSTTNPFSSGTVEPSSRPPSATTTRPETTQQPGKFQHSDGRVAGRYVSLVFDAQQGVVREFSVGGALIIESIPLECPCQTAQFRSEGGESDTLVVASASGSLAVRDHPAAYTLYSVVPGKVLDLRPPQGASVEASSQSARLNVPAGALLARSFASSGAQAGSLERTQAADGRPALRLEGQGFFVLGGNRGQDAIFDANRAVLDEGIVRGHVGAEVQVLSTTAGASPQVLTFDEMTVTVARSQDLEYRMRIDADLPTPRSFVMQFPLSVLPADSVELRRQTESPTGELSEAPLERASSYQDALEALPGEPAKFWVDKTPTGFQVVAAVDHFSVQIFQVIGIPPESAPLFAYAVVFVLVILGIGTVGTLVGRARRPRWRPPRDQISRAAQGQGAHPTFPSSSQNT
jgi:hypothetical protein